MARSDDQKISRDKAKRADKLFEIAVSNYEDVLLELHEMKKAVRACEKYSEAEAKRIVSMVNRTIQNIYTERTRLDEFRKKQDGESAATELDFDAVRTEIRRRLDELRAARGPREIPDGAE
ncbi:hypothetical protein ILP92_04060 [Maribius pontilimi]|uniref:Uncharacterized protein n=1 Tax=Palleronia pontilimi TaxID=1964209 RepID=A0A934IFP3_9RHOB|nr:hypothetical protein [Palleronia pontilimi]MBJ3761921.1 hypothetical protein [Palleronia pontilimi]